MTVQFRLHPSLNPENYQITDSLRDLTRWRAKVLTGNSVGEQSPKVGEWDQVGYVMISLDDDTIIPIARGDEHNTGWDLVYEINEKKPILQDLIPVWTGNNYVYRSEEIDMARKAFAKFLAYGGRAGIVHFKVYDRDGGMTSMEDFVQNGIENATARKGQLSAIAKKIIAAFEEVNQLVVREMKREEDGLPVRIPAIMNSCRALGELLDTIALPYTFKYGDAEKFLNELKDHRRDTSVKWFVEAVFGFHGIKNKLHMTMKENLSVPSWAESREKFWGDRELAIDILAKM